MRRAQLVFGGALALCLLLHPASASPHDDVPTTDDDELDEEDYYGEDVEDVYAHVEVLLDRDDGAADGLAVARAAANERAGLGGSSSAPVGRPQVQEYVFIKTVSRELLHCVEHFCPEDKFDWAQFGESQSDDPYVNSLEMREELAAIGLSLELSDAVETLEEAGYTFQPATE
jgi:hypothetical protein